MTLGHPRHRREIASLILIGLTATRLARGIGGEQLAIDRSAREGAARPTNVLDLVLIDTTHAAPASLIAATDEVQAIWATAGWRVNVIAPDNAARAEPNRRLVPVVIRQIVTLPQTPRHSERSHGGRRPMAWLGLDTKGCPASAIEVSLAEVTFVAMSAEYAGHDIQTLPTLVKNTILGRALGRVIAHEIGHWLFGREHSSAGLMKPVLTPGDLVKIVAPSLPDAWRADGPERLSAASLRCDVTDRS